MIQFRIAKIRIGGFIDFMIFIVTALMIEAAPIIEHFKLKKDMTVYAYPVYKNDHISLIVSGVGKVKSAMAAVYLLSIYNVTEKDILLNIGFCGASSTRYDPGSLLLINKITDMDTGKDYYPDIFFSQNLPKEALCCYSKPVSRKNLKGEIDIFCDMESSGIMEVAKKFTYAHQVVILKVISDYLAPENLNKELLQNYLQTHLPCIEQIINELKELNDNSNELSLKEEEKVLDILSNNLRFTESMKQMLFKEVKRAKLKGMKPLKILQLFIETKVNSKMEGKKIFEQISTRLKEKPF